MKRSIVILSVAAAVALTALLPAQSDGKKKQQKGYRTSPTGYSDTPVLPGQKWKVHDIDRPKPRVVTPGTESSQERPGLQPSDAVVLFNGKDLAQWGVIKRGSSELQPAGWKVENGYMEIVPGSGTIETREKFGDIQLHLEWSAPVTPSGDSQWRANSGVLIMGLYEVQVLDCYNNPTYADGQAASIYGQWPPLVNACRKPGEWQVYDIVFEAPKFANGKLVKPAYETVFHNGVLMHNRQEVIGRMAHRVVGTYAPHEAELPLALQDHDVPLRYRNIWARRLKGYDQQ
ncbi:MAG: DUF1080 domain-containing protein [Acidobacteria bacterium]|nr:DUF1080 domain-containing protein [Acidobacteriota bacterium]